MEHTSIRAFSYMHCRMWSKDFASKAEVSFVSICYIVSAIRTASIPSEFCYLEQHCQLLASTPMLLGFRLALFCRASHHFHPPNLLFRSVAHMLAATWLSMTLVAAECKYGFCLGAVLHDVRLGSSIESIGTWLVHVGRRSKHIVKSRETCIF